MIHLYGIPNCGSVKKALEFLKKREATYTFHDFKKEGVTRKKLAEWAGKTGWETLLNKKGTTWRALSLEQQSVAVNEQGAFELMQQQTSLIKRPVVEWPDAAVTVGFDEALFSQKL
jgi:Spx/MgsR family transcriptional regulator